MTPELKPCPWCGPDQVTAGHTARDLFRAGCEKCDIQWTRPTYDEAVAAWNRRAIPEVSVNPERVAQLIAHRAVGGNEHDGMSKFHGNCAVCLVEWPCEYAGTPPAKRTT